MSLLNWNSELLVSDTLNFLFPSETVTNNIRVGGYFLRGWDEENSLLLMDMVELKPPKCAGCSLPQHNLAYSDWQCFY